MTTRAKNMLDEIRMKLSKCRHEYRRQEAADRVLKHDAIRGGQVWTNIKNNAPYQVLFLTNLYNDGHIQVVYSQHWAYIYSMPVEDFFEQFTQNLNIDNTLASAHDDLMAMATNMRGSTRLRLPQEGERWTRVDRIPDGFDENRMPVYRPQSVTVVVEGIVEQSPAHPFVLFKEGGERKVLNMYMFLNFYSPEGENNVA
ncbi:hypothetical protein MPK67_gp041 [Erwinia phage pEa_SNUABM_32]|uniref:Uncharacterized protein n=2 Tax=Alexandravirus TaxID=2733088 RepID=A0AAE7XIN7_9CAUD|nr:hypothetical protein MPK67_gp041 [Erwinia phage pEa_SNUABM_32]YP_010301154.1 hypothetical protein MPK68_gp041 [Erwinia phage pEa_SNUABM_3]QZE56578.1 hypothetical protein pEaSNUABM20_00042 [Erwinia phage pEa_SNUABM_20]QZE58257.1 hypothetical protein pEaSNUABM40_00041 [Erwinia phage pEa_SNUABM_40]UAW52823.1 hypothetical protein pEaSNUABM23_00041 [Erwinia phage pEa_SNUABM_23]UIW10719.1 hypothetical protein pEaSNUABM23_00041 [Erwinia phage pEa_SNUABM_31]QZE56238.1 hypothetical protein pEaSNUAB